MPPPPEGVPAIVFGDCRGRTADAWVSADAMTIVKRLGFDAGLNDPFAGGHVIERHARPANGIHSLQVEIDRHCYLDTRLMKPGRGFDRVATLIETLAVELGQELLGRRYATAAE
jgi:N-formylglutamate amidohydrolase